jgi:hypothetical protein
MSEDRMASLSPRDGIAPPGRAYESGDLALMESLLDEILVVLGARGEIAEAPGEAPLRVRAAAALFRSAEAGERDPEALKRAVVAALSGPAQGTPS